VKGITKVEPNTQRAMQFEPGLSLTLRMASIFQKLFLKAVAATHIIGYGVSGFLILLGISKVIDALGNTARGDDDDDDDDEP
jgi:hypothetical protein